MQHDGTGDKIGEHNQPELCSLHSNAVLTKAHGMSCMQSCNAGCSKYTSASAEQCLQGSTQGLSSYRPRISDYSTTYCTSQSEDNTEQAGYTSTPHLRRLFALIDQGRSSAQRTPRPKPTGAYVCCCHWPSNTLLTKMAHEEQVLKLPHAPSYVAMPLKAPQGCPRAAT